MAVIIHSLADLEDFQDTSEPEKLVFRGQGNAAWGLVPSLYRDMESLNLDSWETHIADRERDIFRDFHDRSKRFWRGGSPWDTLVMARHYGTPTRLLDWTPEARTALFFACASTPLLDGVIWYANPSKLPMPDIGRIHLRLGFRKERLAQYISEQELPFCRPFSKAGLLSGATPPASPQSVFDQNGVPELSGILTFLFPEHIDDRIAAQDGLFSVYNSEQSADEIVIDHAEYLRTVGELFKCPHLGQTDNSRVCQGCVAAQIVPRWRRCSLGLSRSAWTGHLL